jgi:hypothetical protein
MLHWTIRTAGAKGTPRLAAELSARSSPIACSVRPPQAFGEIAMSQSSDVERGSEEHRRLLARARADYEVGSDDDIEIDEDAAVSKGEGGCWVAAWVWVAVPEPHAGAGDA